MRVIVDGQEHKNIDVTPSTTIAMLKQYFNQHFPNHTIKLTFSNGQELSPVVWNTNQYDAMNFQSHAALLNGIIELKTDKKLNNINENNTENIKKMEKYTNFMLTGNQTAIDSWLGQMDTLYAAGTPAVTDEVYDSFVDIYTKRFGSRNVVGAPATADDVLLPIAMMSLDKVKKHEPKILQNWIAKNPGPYVAMDKINGNSGLYTITQTPKGAITKLYKRGNGTKGPDISRVLKYLNLPVLPFDVFIKGELVIDKKDFEPYKGNGKDQYKTNLSMSTGLLNPKNLSANPDHLKLVKFIAFDMVFPKNQDITLNMSQTLENLKKYGFHVPFYIKTPAITIDWLGQLYHRQKTQQTYDVDGIVIMADRSVKYNERLLRENPKYGIAYKELGQEYETTVTHIVWKASKRGILTPVVHVEETPVGDTGFTIRHPTGHNAKFLQTHGIGPGARIVVVHNTIPKIVRTVEGYEVEPALPPADEYPRESWEWNETRVEIVLMHLTAKVRIAKLYEFFRKDKINAKGWGEKTIEKLFEAGHSTLKKLLETDKAGFMRYDARGDLYIAEGIGEKGIENLIKARDIALPNASPATIMAGTVTFDHGIGTRMIQKVIDVYPNILDFNPTLEQIVAIEGFADITAQKFVDGLIKFKSFISDIPILQKAVRGQLKKIGTISPPKKGKAAAVVAVGTPTGQTLSGMNVVFTGFRDQALEAYVKSQGGDVKKGVSKKVNYLILGGPKGAGSSKEKKAIQYNIPVLSIGEFKGMFGIP